MLLSVKTLFDYCDGHLFFSFPCNLSTKGQIQREKNKKAWYFFSILNYWFTCLSSVGSPLFAKIFTLGNIILGISLNVQDFQTRSNCFEWKSLMKHGHSTKSNNFWSQSNFEFSYRSKWNSHKENYYFGGARSKGFATLRNVSKLPFFDKIGQAKSVGFRFYSAIWRSESRISSRYLEITSISFIYSLTFSRKKELFF